MLSIYHNIAFTTPVILVRTFDGYTPATGIVSGDVSLKYRKDGDTSLSTYTLLGDSWQELGDGLYDINWVDSISDTLGDLVYTVDVSGSVPFYGRTEVVTVKTSDVFGYVTGIPEIHEVHTVVTGIDEVTDDIFGVVTGISTAYPAVMVGASLDGQRNVGISLSLEREGNLVPSITSGRYELYNETGSMLASGTSVTGDSQGVISFTTQVTLPDDSVPYVHGFVTDSIGTVSGRTFLPVVG